MGDDNSSGTKDNTGHRLLVELPWAQLCINYQLLDKAEHDMKNNMQIKEGVIHQTRRL